MWTVNPPRPSLSVDKRAVPWKWRRNGEGIERKWRANGEGEEGDEREVGKAKRSERKGRPTWQEKRSCHPQKQVTTNIAPFYSTFAFNFTIINIP
jgi:hypothetical protein